MANLSPEKRVNKLGIAVTKHVRVDPKASSSKASLPAPSAKTIAAASKQLDQRQRTISGFEYMADFRFTDLITPGDYKFDASDEEMYAVMSVADSGDAFALLSMGIRNASEAREQLLDMDAPDLIVDRATLMTEMLGRRVSPEDTSSSLTMITDEDLLSPYVADAVEFMSLRGFESTTGSHAVCLHILAGEIKLSDIKTIGAKRLISKMRLRDLTGTLVRHASEETNFDLDDFKHLLDKAEKDDIVKDALIASVELLDKRGIEAVDKLNHLSSYTTMYAGLSKKNAEEVIDEAYYSALLCEAIVEAMSESGETSKVTFRGLAEDAAMLRAEGITPELAAVHMSKGLSAHQVIGIFNNSVEPVVAEGWL